MTSMTGQVDLHSFHYFIGWVPNLGRLLSLALRCVLRTPYCRDDRAEWSGAEQSRAEQTKEEGWFIHSSIISYSFIHHLLKVPVIGIA
jgi:hypothetical protein